MVYIGGGAGIRTLERVAPLPVFKTGAFNRSATPPHCINVLFLLNTTVDNIRTKAQFK